MIYVECYADEVLVRAITGLPPREISHELKGRSRVVNRVSRGRARKGLVDEDPATIQPAYFSHMNVLQDLPGMGLRLLRDNARDNYIVVICPRLEEWIVRAARDTGIDLARYSLPSDPGMMHREINDRLSSFQRLVEDLRDTPRLRALAGLLRG
jgi:hypothetical protein